MKGLSVESKKISNIWNRVAVSIIIVNSFLLLKIFYSTHLVSQKVSNLLNEKGIEPLRPISYTKDPSKFKEIFTDEFRSIALPKFQGSIKIDTQSYDNYPDPKDDITPWLKFYKFHDYLSETFPLVHSTLKLEKVNKVNLLYTWEGSNSDLKPLLLTAHQDTVPIDEKSIDKWTYDPLSGHFDGDYVWGRGSVDCKQLLVGLLQTVEKLINDGFKPERTILLAFGNDEESGGFGAVSINDTLRRRYGHDSMYAIVDEGSSIMKINDNWYALPSTGEKGRINLDISLNTPGGHSSIPPDHTSIGIVSQLINLLESNQFKPILTNKNPFLKFLQIFAKTSTNLPSDLKNDLLKAEFDPIANRKVIEWISKDQSKKYLIQTSQAIDVIKGGVKSNALPEYVSFVYNSRISVESTINETVEHVLKHVKTISKKFDLGLIYQDEILIPKTNNGYFEIINDDAIEALPVTPSNGTVWDVLEGTVKHVYEDEILNGEKIYTAPAIMTGNTDTKSYWQLSKNIFRFYGSRLDLTQDFGLHSINEHIPFNSYLEGIAFLYEFIQNVDKAN